MLSMEKPETATEINSNVVCDKTAHEDEPQCRPLLLLEKTRIPSTEKGVGCSLVLEPPNGSLPKDTSNDAKCKTLPGEFDRISFADDCNDVAHSQEDAGFDSDHDAISRKRDLCPCIQKAEGKDAWLVAIMCAILTFCIATEFSSFGIYYIEYTAYFGVTKSVAGWIKGLQTIAGGVFGVVSSTLVKVYGCRRIAPVGGMLFFLGLLLASFASNIYLLYATQGVLVGIGSHTLNMCVAVVTQHHFVRNPMLGLGVAYTGFTVGGFIGPVFISALIDKYGLKGALLIHSAVVAHSIPAAMFLRKAKSRRPKSDPDKFPPKTLSVLTRIQQDICDFSLLRNYVFVLISIAGLFLWYGITSFVSHLPGRAVFYGTPRPTAAYLPSVISIASFIARMFSTFVANTKRLNKIIYYACGILLVSTGTLSFSMFSSFKTMILSPVLFGLGMGICTTVYPVMLVHLFGIERLPRSIGLSTIANCAGMSLGPPLSGTIFDSTRNYNYPFLLAGCLGYCSSLLAFIVNMLHTRRLKRTPKAEQLDTIPNEEDNCKIDLTKESV